MVLNPPINYIFCPLQNFGLVVKYSIHKNHHSLVELYYLIYNIITVFNNLSQDSIKKILAVPLEISYTISKYNLKQNIKIL